MPACRMGAGELLARKVPCAELLVLQSRSLYGSGAGVRPLLWVFPELVLYRAVLTGVGLSSSPPFREQMLLQHFLSGKQSTLS